MSAVNEVKTENDFSSFGDYLRNIRNKKIDETKKKDVFSEFMAREWAKIKEICRQGAANGFSEMEYHPQVNTDEEKFILNNREDEIKDFFKLKGFISVWFFKYCDGTYCLHLKW